MVHSRMIRNLHQPHAGLRCVLGIDPSLRGTGWAVVAASGREYKTLGYGTVKVRQEIPQSSALLLIHEEITRVIQQHRPDICAIESTIYVQSFKTAITLGSARAASIIAAAKAGLEVVEFAPRSVKQAVTGRGGAQKTQVAFMIRALLGLDHTPAADAADALGVALAFLQQGGKTDIQQ
jgi:crossover junction endodeoxyribonuclease RuvC